MQHSNQQHIWEPAVLFPSAIGGLVVCLLLFLWPGEYSTIGDNLYRQPLITQYSAAVVWGILLHATILLAVGWYKKQKWYRWIGLIAGLLLGSFAITRCLGLSSATPLLWSWPFAVYLLTAVMLITSSWPKQAGVEPPKP